MAGADEEEEQEEDLPENVFSDYGPSRYSCHWLTAMGFPSPHPMVCIIGEPSQLLEKAQT